MTAAEFLNSEFDDIELLIKYVKSNDSICGVKPKNLIDMNWGDVQDLMQTYSEGDVIGTMVKVTGVKEKKILKQDHREFMYFWRWLHLELEGIRDREAMLVGDSNHDLIEAGIDEMGKFGFINSLDALAQGDVTKWDEVYKMPYQDIYMKQLKDKEMSEIEQRYQEIMSRKSKRK